MRYLTLSLVLLFACGPDAADTDATGDTDSSADTNADSDATGDTDTENDTDTAADTDGGADADPFLTVCDTRVYYAGCDSLLYERYVEAESGTRTGTLWDSRGNISRFSYYTIPTGELEESRVYAYVDYFYTADRLDRVTHTNEGTVTADFVYTYDDEDVLTQIENLTNGGLRTYEYDADGNLIVYRSGNIPGYYDSVETYEYDAEGRLTRKTSDNNEDGLADLDCSRVWTDTASGGRSYTETCVRSSGSTVEFDSRGLVVREVYASASGATTITRTWRNDCQPATFVESWNGDSATTTYTYDADRRLTRTSKVARGAEVFYATTTYTCE